MPEAATTKVFNHDVLLIAQGVNRYIDEMAHSQSANVSGLTPADKARLLSYTAALRRLRDWVQAQPILDLPETHPRQFELEADPVVPEIENDAIAQIIRLFEAARIELVNSASARMASRLVPHDEARLTAIIEKIDSFVTSYIDPSEPLDLPESSPQESPVGPGRGGI